MEFDIKKFEAELEDLLEKYDLDKSYNYFNGETGIWIFDKDRTTEINIGIKYMPDEDDIKNFEDNLND